MSDSRNNEKWKEIERNLAEQESFVQSITQPQYNKSVLENDGNIQNILSSSIQKAKEKISHIESRNSNKYLGSSRQKISHSRERKEKGGEDGSALAAAMKKLQSKVAELEKQKQSLAKQCRIAQKQVQMTKQEKQILRSSYEEIRRKSKNLESSLLNDKNYIKELQGKIRSLEKAFNDKKAAKKQSQLEQKLSTSEMLYRAQNQEMKNMMIELESKEKQLMNVENLRKQEQIRHLQQQSMMKSFQNELDAKVRESEQRNQKKDILIQQLKQEIKNLQLKKANKPEIERNHEDHELSSIMEMPKSHIKKSRNRNILNLSPSHRQINLQEELQEQKQRYNELIQSYRQLDQRSKREKAETKNFRNKFWEIKDLTKQIIDKISMLPNGVTSQLRYLIVKVNKIEAFGPDYYASTPTKSNRKRSLMGNNLSQRSHSKSRSKSKSKLRISNLVTNQSRQDLNCSKNSAKSNRSVRSNRTNSKNKNKVQHKQKQIIVSQKSLKTNQIKVLQQQIQDIRKRYKQLLKSQDRNTEEVAEDIRNQLNDLAMLLQDKSQELTKLKRKK